MAKKSAKARKPSPVRKVDLSKLGIPSIDPATIANPDIRNFLSHTGNLESQAKAFWMLGVEAEQRMDWTGAIDCYQVVLRIQPADPLSRYFSTHNMAFALIQLKRFEEAVPYAEAAIRLNEGWPFGYHTLGVALNQLGKYPEAAYAFLTAIWKGGQKSNDSWRHLQAMLGAHPDVLVAVPRLAGDVEQVRRALESRGLLPRTH